MSLIVANWKMHKTGEEAKTFIERLQAALPTLSSEVWIAPPFTSIEAAVQATRGMPIRIGAQNMHEEREGAYTGQISPSMLKAVGASFVILGHSECRHIFFESDERVHAKLRSALHEGLTPILCIGETLEQRERGETETTLATQLISALGHLPPQIFENLHIAYEPVWAIGTGRVASPVMAQEAHLEVRKILANSLGEMVAASARLLYGGSVKPENIGSLLEMPDIDGALVGGASLNVASFIKLAQGGA